jgi:hypothetical protein
MLKFLLAVGIGAILGRILVPILLLLWLISSAAHGQPYAIAAVALLVGCVLVVKSRPSHRPEACARLKLSQAASSLECARPLHSRQNLDINGSRLFIESDLLSRYLLEGV